MSLAAHSVGAALGLLAGPGRWHVVEDRYGIVDVTDVQPQSLSTVKLWSLSDGPVDWPNEADKLQVELVVTLPWLEERLVKLLGSAFANEMGKTVSVFLHRLVPNGLTYAAGFPISHNSGQGKLSVRQLAQLIAAHGVPFFSSVTSGDAFDDGAFLSPKLLDPVNWTVRRAIALEWLGRHPSARAALVELAPKVESDLQEKYTAIAAISRSSDPAERVRSELARFHSAIEALRGDA